MPKLTNITVSLNLPFIGEISGTWEPDDTERRAAWEMYIELVTRISFIELKPGEGMLHEALSSLYTLFETTRKILRDHGPSVARPKGSGKLSFGYLAIAIINCIIRPILTKWHPILLSYENAHKDSIVDVQYEQQWEYNDQLRQELNSVRIILVQYTNLLAQIAEVPAFTI